jgi:hypothetical protein
VDAHAISPCDFAVERYRNIARWRDHWTTLLFVFGTTVILFLCASILLFIGSNWLPGAVSTLGTIVNGAAVTWVLSRRNEAVREEEEAYKDVEAKCGEAKAKQLRPR